MYCGKIGKKIYQHAFRSIDVPDDLADVRDIDTKSEAAASNSGLSADDIDEIWSAAEALFNTGIHPLMSFCLRRHGQVVLNRSLGYIGGIGCDETHKTPKIASVDTPVCLFSASKVVSAMLIHLLAEQGKVNLLDPVSYYIPDFAQKGKGNITIHQMLSHRGGVPSINEEDVDVDLLFDHDATLNLICESEPTDPDGRIMAYHAVTSGFLFDELIRVTTGMDIQQYLDKYIRKPLGMKYFRYGLAKKDFGKAATNYATGMPNGRLIGGMLRAVFGVEVDESIDLSNEKRFYQAVVPSANLFATAEEVSRFFQVLLNHGQWQGERIFDPLTIHRATREVSKTRLDKSLFLPMRYSAGMMLGGKPIGIYGRNSHYAFGHIGFANIFCWADSARDISAAILTTGKPVLGPHIKALPGLIGTIAERCEPVVDMTGDEPHYMQAMC